MTSVQDPDKDQTTTKETSSSYNSQVSNMVLEIPHCLHMTVLAIAKQVKLLRKLTQQSKHDAKMHFELEARLGTYSGNSFTPGVNYETLEHIQRMLESYDNWDSMSPQWVEMHDYFYPSPTIEGGNIRSTVQFQPDSARKSIDIVHLLKKRLSKLDVAYQGEGTESAYNMRFTLAQEVTIDKDDVPDIVKPRFIRIKKRREFSKGCWRFDLTKTWSGATRIEAEQKMNSEPIYEVEVECIDPKSYLSQDYHTDQYVATSILVKLLDFVMLPPTYTLVPIKDGGDQ